VSRPDSPGSTPGRGTQIEKSILQSYNFWAKANASAMVFSGRTNFSGSSSSRSAPKCSYQPAALVLCIDCESDAANLYRN
jgi:hypothetical protein